MSNNILREIRERIFEHDNKSHEVLREERNALDAIALTREEQLEERKAEVKEFVEYFERYPGAAKTLDKFEKEATARLKSLARLAPSKEKYVTEALYLSGYLACIEHLRNDQKALISEYDKLFVKNRK